ncbi:MAG: metallophosphoesterase [Nanoarchaeota archaeon]|nr:metallophosphoesterase [Nanoarchaeota archaeon]MBU4033131.1 metallophosphoesterase [Candidatus Thermoplasmatota archaeon]MBU4123885.1 metallophosphoesterase [Nanoarchaeota archaeon]
MIIAAISDLDVLGNDISEFFKLLKKMKEPDLLIFAGDMYEWANPKQYKKIQKAIKWKCPVVAVFGNREFPEDEKEIMKSAKKIKFLKDESITLKIKGKTVGIVGSRGVLDSPSFWQKMNINGIEEFYQEELETITRLLTELKTDIKILVTHYAPTYRTLTGEPMFIYSGLGTKRLEKVMKDTKVTLAIHGHAHYGRDFAVVGNIPVYNVCLCNNGKITIIDTDKL